MDIPVHKSALQVAIETNKSLDEVRNAVDCQLLCVDSDHKQRIDFETFRAAIERGELPIVELLFREAEICEGENRLKYVRVAGHWIQSALNKGREELAKYLLSWGVTYNFSDSTPGIRALVRYLREGNNAKAEQLIGLGVSTTLAACQFEPQDPLLIALEHNCLGAAAKILRQRADAAAGGKREAAAPAAPRGSSEPSAALAAAPPAPGRERLRNRRDGPAAAPASPQAPAAKDAGEKGGPDEAASDLVRPADRALVLRRALQKKCTETVSLLLRSRDYTNETAALMRALKLQEGYETVQKLAEALDGETRERLLLQCLTFAAENGTNEFARVLLKLSADGGAPLHRPAWHEGGRRSPLEIALTNWYLGLAKMMLARWRAGEAAPQADPEAAPAEDGSEEAQKKKAEERKARDEEAAKAAAGPRAEEACNVLRLALARKYADLIPAILDRGGREIGGGHFDVPTNALALALELPGPNALPLARRVLRGLAPRAPATREHLVAEALKHASARGLLEGVRFLVEAAGARELPAAGEECVRAALAGKHAAVAGYLLTRLARPTKKLASIPGIAATAVRAGSAEKLEELIDKEADVDILVSERDEDPSAPAREMHLIALALLKGGPAMAASVAATGPRSLLKLAGVEALAKPYEKGQKMEAEKATRAQRVALGQLCFQASFSPDWRLRLYSAAILHVLETDGAEVPLDVGTFSEEMVAQAGRRLHGPTRDALVPHLLRAARAEAGRPLELAKAAGDLRSRSVAEAEEGEHPPKPVLPEQPTPAKRKAESKPAPKAKKAKRASKGGEEKEEEKEEAKEEEPKEEAKEEPAEEVKVPEGLEELAKVKSYAGLRLATREELVAYLAELAAFVPK